MTLLIFFSRSNCIGTCLHLDWAFILSPLAFSDFAYSTTEESFELKAQLYIKGLVKWPCLSCSTHQTALQLALILTEPLT